MTFRTLLFGAADTKFVGQLDVTGMVFSGKISEKLLAEADRLVREGYLSQFHSHLLPHYGPQIAAECYLDSPDTWGKSLAFFRTVKECLRFQEVLAAGGVLCEVVTSDSDKERQLEDFLSGKVKVIADMSV